MFIGNARRGRGDTQSARGAFLLLGVPNARPPGWQVCCDSAKARCLTECAAAGRVEWFWKDYLTPDEKLAGYGEGLYHAPFTEARGFVRTVTLKQMGHWMMGHATIGGREITVSGSYGEDGLPMSWDRGLWERGVPLPEDIALMWAKGGGHNQSGAEGASVHAWATANLRALRAAGRTK
jgi:hypothetical protein